MCLAQMRKNIKQFQLKMVFFSRKIISILHVNHACYLCNGNSLSLFSACEFYGLIGGIFGLMSINTMAAIAVDRYYAIARPLQVYTFYLQSALSVLHLSILCNVFVTPKTKR